METRAKFAIIGLFTLVSIAAAFGFVYWFAGSRGGAERIAYRIVFNGPVTGLPRGGAVLFNGIRIGEVVSLNFDAEDPNRVNVGIEVDQKAPIKASTKARLEFAGLTGVGSIQLIGGNATEPPLRPLVTGEPPTIVADRSDFQNLLETAQNVARRVDDMLGKVETLVATNAGPVSRTIENAERFSAALASNAPAISGFLAQTGEASQRIAALSVTVERLAGELETIVKSVEPGVLRQTLRNVESATGALAENRDRIGTVLTDVSELARRLNQSAGKLDGALESVAELAKAIDGPKINRTLENVDRFAASLGGNAETVDRTLKDSGELVAKLNAAANRIDGVLRSAENLLGSGEAKSALSEFGETAKSIRILAGNLDKRTAELAANLNRFTGPGLRDVEALATDGRRTLSDLNRVLRNLERNPQQFIFGGRPSIPEYSGTR